MQEVDRLHLDQRKLPVLMLLYPKSKSDMSMWIVCTNFGTYLTRCAGEEARDRSTEERREQADRQERQESGMAGSETTQAREESQSAAESNERVQPGGHDTTEQRAQQGIGLQVRKWFHKMVKKIRLSVLRKPH